LPLRWLDNQEKAFLKRQKSLLWPFFFYFQGNYGNFPMLLIFLLYFIFGQVKNCLLSYMIIIKNHFENTKLPFNNNIEDFAFKGILVFSLYF